jgi:hypothetical protein
MLGFLIGAIAGGLAATYWHRELGSFRDQHLPRLRNQTADKLEAAERTIVEGVKKVSTHARTRLRREDASTPHHEDPVSDRIGGPR